jgi:hypothetical protein
MPLTQLWAHWGLTDFSQFLQFVLISSNKIHSKINTFHTLAQKIVKLTLLNLTHWGLFNNTKNASKFQYSFQFQVYLIFIEKIIQ